MKIGRNDVCPCGSGKKYKKCCLMKDSDHFKNWKNNADFILKNKSSDEAEVIKKIYFTMLEYIQKKSWIGACHSTSAIMYVLYNEFGIDAKLCLGEVKFDSVLFDHSWIEIENKVYDIAISFPQMPIKLTEPVLDGLNIETLKQTIGEYGVCGKGLDIPASEIIKVSLTDYINSAPDNMLWEILKELTIKLGKTFNKNEVMIKYSSVKWEYRH